MTTPAHDVAKYLASLGIGTWAGANTWAIYAFQEPTEPENVITVYDTGGAGPDTDEMDWQRPTFQVRVRCKVYRDGYAKHLAIRNALLLTSPITMLTSVFIGINMTSDIVSLGKLDNNLFALTANYTAIRKEN